MRPREGPAGEGALATCLEKLHAAIATRVAGTGEERALTITGRNVPGGYLLTYAGAFPWEEIVGAEKAIFDGARVAFKVFGLEKLELFWRFAIGKE
ncbi:MAG: hypothetical protein ACUVTA_08335 [Thermodesulfitimonas sp.]